MLKSVVIIGAGNVAFHLTRALLVNTVDVRQIFNRTLEHAQKIGEANSISYTNKISELEKADLYIIAASDSAIEELSYFIPFDDVLVVHTSGTMGLDVLKGNYRKGAFYPLQTFTKGQRLEYRNIPFFIEGENEEDAEKLYKLASKISSQVHLSTNETRKIVHNAGVWVNNFTNHMYYIGSKLCDEAGLPFDVLRPLIEETSKKVLDLSPYDAQTGPARRGDEITTQRHMEMLTQSHWQNIYKAVTDSIKHTYHHDEL